MSVSLEQLTDKYPEAHVWAFGDSAELADRLVTLVIAGKKVARCSRGVRTRQSRSLAATALCWMARASRAASSARRACS